MRRPTRSRSNPESAIQDALDTYARGRTVVVIAHRLATVADADQVIVLGVAAWWNAVRPQRSCATKASSRGYTACSSARWRCGARPWRIGSSSLS
jgi:hypothetical protein